MTHDEFLERCLADPHDQSDDFLAALADPDNAAFHAEVLADDDRLYVAASVPVPGGLKQNIKLRNQLEQISAQVADSPTQTRKAPVLQWAMAASLLVSVGVAGFLGVKLQDAEKDVDVLRVAILEHMMDEHEVLAKTQQVSLKDVNKVLGGFGLKANEKLGPVTFAMRCPMHEHHHGAHLVVMEGAHAVTVMYMNQEMLDKPHPLNYRRFQGKLMPDEHGSWAVIGESAEDTEKVIKRVSESISRAF